MLIIRDQQLKLLRDALYADQLAAISVAQLTDLYPDELSHLSQEQRRRRVEYGTRRALQLGFTDLTEILLYTEAALLLGCEFHDRAECAWVQAMLTDPAPSPLSERLRIIGIRARMLVQLANAPPPVDAQSEG